MIFQGENVSIYTYYKNVYKKDGFRWTLKIFHCKIKVWWWTVRENKKACVWVFKFRFMKSVKKYIGVLRREG